MLTYLPERLYEYIKNDQTYHKLSDEYTDKYMFDNDFLQIIKHFKIRENDLNQLFEYIRDKLPKQEQLEYDILMSDNPNIYQDRFDEMDTETKIYFLYTYDNGDMSWNLDAEKRNQLTIQLYEDEILDKPYPCSLFIHTIYYLRKVYELILKYTNRKITIKEFHNFVNEEQSIFDKMFSISDNESYKHIMYSKREQMYTLYLEFVGQFIEDRTEFYNLLWNIVNNVDFKYNYFSYFKLTFFLIFYQEYVDSGDIINAKKCLDKLLEMITYAFQNRKDASKSLNHYNKAFIDDFLILSKFVYDMVIKYMPNVNKKWKLATLMNRSEQRFYHNMLTNDDKEIVKDFNVVDRFFGYAWLINKREIFESIDQFYLDN